MDHPALRWIAAGFLALLMAWVPGESAAYGTVSQTPGQFRWALNGGDTMGQYIYGSCVQACVAKTPAGSGATVDNHQCGTPSTGVTNITGVGTVPAQTAQCTYRVSVDCHPVHGCNVFNQQTQMYAAMTPASCPANATSTASGCVCNKGFRRANQGMSADSCEPYTCKKGALSYANSGVGPVTQETAMAQRASCVGPGGPHAGCEMEFTPTSAKCADPTHCYASGTDQTSGDYCDGPQPTDPTPPERPAEPKPPVPCPTGQCPGSVNGVSGCFPCNTSTTNNDGKTTTTTTNPDGTKTTTEKETTTTCNGDMCTTETETTTTTRNPDGTIVGEPDVDIEVEEEPQSSFCEENPTSPLCKEGAFSGSCAEGFTCDGDPVQCATAKASHEARCLMSTPGLAADYEALPGKGEAHPDGHPANDGTTVDVMGLGSSLFSDTSAASCPTDVSVTVMGHTAAIPLSEMCDPLAWMGRIAWAFALVNATFIFMRRL